MATLTLNTPVIQSLLTRAGLQATGSRAEKVAERARVLAPVRSGRLRDSIRVVQNSSGGHSVVALVPYGQAVEEGSQPHIIRAKNADALYFRWEKKGGLPTVVPKRATGGGARMQGGVLIINKGYVNHPGTQPVHYLKRAFDEVMGQGG